MCAAGNAFCDQNQHAEAVPLYLRALAIDQAALGDDHPEVAMDLSNLGIVYRVQVYRVHLCVACAWITNLSLETQLDARIALDTPYAQGRRDEAIALFQRAHTIMTEALGSDDPKTLTVARNLSATQVIEVPVVASPRALYASLDQKT